MDMQSMLKQMCESDINDSDIKAICKSRGFPVKEAASRDVFENFFISTIGIEEALNSLTYREVVFLHFLSKINKRVGIGYFERLYGSAESANGYYRMTATKRYRETLKKVKNNLVRKGVLISIVKEQKTYIKYTKMERLRFFFPPEFGEFLPPIASASTFNEAGDLKRAVLRDKLLELAGGRERPSPLSKSEQRSFTLTINEGNLSIGGEQFRAKCLLDWQKASLCAAVKTDTKERGYQGYPSHDMAPVDAALYALSQLGAHEWLPADGLAVILKIFTGEDVDHPEQICEAGWEWGCLAKVVADKTAYYRLPGDSLKDATSPPPDQYLQIVPDGTVVVNLVKIPYTALETLASVALMEIHNANLRATANIIKIGDALTTVRKEGVFEWLEKNSSGFRTAIRTAEKRWGKQVIHECLMVARVQDLSLKVQIEKSYTGSQLVSLPNDYIAFPCDLLPAIRKLVEKSGHVIKKARTE